MAYTYNLTGGGKTSLLFMKEKTSILRRTKMSHPSVYANAIKRRKVSYFHEFFNEKTATALEEDHANETAPFLKVIAIKMLLKIAIKLEIQ